MHFEKRLWVFTQGVRLRILWAVLIGVAGTGFGIARLALLGWLIGTLLSGATLIHLAWPIAAIALVMIFRGVFEHWRAMVAHETASRVQAKLRQAIFAKIAALGPGAINRQRSGILTASLIDGVEQLESYFGQFLPQFLIALFTPILIFAAIAVIDLPVATVLLGFALVALFAPGLWHRFEVGKSRDLQQAYSGYAAEFLDSVQGLATLKAFGQSEARADKLEGEARNLYRRTMWVLATNVLSRGLTDSSIACGAAFALILGAYRVEAGAMELTSLLVILMLGVEVFRPMRELRNVLHEGMVGMAAAQGIYRLFDAPLVLEDAPESVASQPLAPTIAFEKVSFAYPGTRRLVHCGLDFSVAAGERIGIVGGSGGGKSSIVRLLLRFYDPTEGTVRLGGRDLRSLTFAEIRSMIAVVNQDCVLFHGSIADNIRMGRPEASDAELEEAARAANIHDFIAGLPDGYQSVVGERGIKLSGGQRQRLAIARAILKDAPILVLDEALSAIDAANEAVIQAALDRLMQGRTTLVFAHRLSSIIGCDRILVLDQGRIAETGTHATLMAAGGVYATLMREQAEEAGATVMIDDGAMATDPAAKAGDPAQRGEAGLTEGVIKAEGLGWLELVVQLMKLALPWKGRLTFTFLFGVLRVLAFIGVGVLSALIVLDLKNGVPFTPWVWALVALALLSGVLHWLESFIAHDMAFRLLADMRMAAFRKLDQLAPAYLVRRRTGDLMALVTRDIELVEYFFAHTMAPAFVAVLVPAVVLVVLALADLVLPLTLLPFLLAVGLCPFVLRGRVDRLGSAAREAAGELAAFAVDSVQGLGEIVAFQQEENRARQLAVLTERHVRLRLPFYRELTLQQCLLEIFTGLGGLAVVVAGAWAAQAGRLDAALLPLLTILAMAAFLPVSEIAQVGRQLADTLGATRRISGLMREPVPVTDGAGVAMMPGAASLAVEEVTFTYPGQAAPALRNVSLPIPAGKTVALVGMSGAGKTTLAQLLLRFWDPQAGRLTLNGRDLRDYRLDDLRAHVALVAQDTYLFNDSLRHNLLIARPGASEAELQAAVRHASLQDLVEGLPDGLDSAVGERGASLSGGQRQRVAIARAFLKDAPILILDEATSHLDALNERAVREALDRLKADRTTIVIAHRLSTIRDADLIVVLGASRVLEMGRHADLLAAKGTYAQLVAHQMAAAAQ